MFSPEVVIPVVLAALGIAFTVALAPTIRNIRLAHWFFAIAAVWTCGGMLRWLAEGDVQMKYLISFLACGVIGTLWLASYTWVEGNHKEQARQQEKPAETTKSESTSTPTASGKLVCQVMTVQFEPVFRFFQSPPVYFQRLDTMLRVSLTNQTGKPLSIRGYSVAVLKGVDWIQFKNADSAAYEPYAFGVMESGDKPFIRRFNLSTNGFDYVTHQKALNPDESMVRIPEDGDQRFRTIVIAIPG
jgi:hypothetical protein